ncbi:MAG: DNA polymerase III subunit [Lutibacter sp.]
MEFSAVLGHENLKKHLIQTVNNDRISHAQLFIGNEGSGVLPLAIAYANYILCYYDHDEDCSKRSEELNHPDLHFAFPVVITKSVKKNPLSKDFYQDWITFLKLNPYGNLFEWMQSIDAENKQGNISVAESEEIVKSLKLKSYKGGFKIMIIWLAEKMHPAAANKLLKLLEEPPEKTLFLLVSEKPELLLNTIKSRCQIIQVPNYSEYEIEQGLIQFEGTDAFIAKQIAVQVNGNYNSALHLLHNDDTQEQFEAWFIAWVRTAFKAKENTTVLKQLVEWSQIIAGSGRETQKKFLNFCLQLFRQAMLVNYQAEPLVFFKSKHNFDLTKFAPFVHSENILEITQELNEAIFAIERNGNAKIVLLDLSIKLTRLLHKKEKK